MNQEFIELLGLKVEVKTPPKPPNKIKSRKVINAPEYFLEAGWSEYFPSLGWDQKYIGYLIENSIYIDGDEYPKHKIDGKYITIYPELSQNLNNELLRNILIKMTKKIDELESRLDNI